MARLDTASTIRMASELRVTAAKPRTSCSTPVDDSLCWVSTALTAGYFASVSATRSAGTVWPNSAPSSMTSTP
jgi:hypothetical protein